MTRRNSKAQNASNEHSNKSMKEDIQDVKKKKQESEGRKSKREKKEKDGDQGQEVQSVEKSSKKKTGGSENIETKKEGLKNTRKRKIQENKEKNEDRNDVVDGDTNLSTHKDVKVAKLDPWPQRSKAKQVHTKVMSSENKDNLNRATKKRVSEISNCDELEDFEPSKKQKVDCNASKELRNEKIRNKSLQNVILENTIKAKKEKRQSLKGSPTESSAEIKNPVEPKTKSQKNQKLNVNKGKKDKIDEPKAKCQGNQETVIKKDKNDGKRGKKSEQIKGDSKSKSRSKSKKAEKPQQKHDKIEAVEIMSDDSSEEEPTIKGLPHLETSDHKIKHHHKKEHLNTKQKSKGQQKKLQVMPQQKPNIDMKDVTSVLLMMEGLSKKQSNSNPMPSTSGLMGEEDEDDELMEDSSEEEESDWEEVAALPGHDSPKKSQVPPGPIEITLDGPQIMKKRKKKQFDVKAYFKRLANRFQKELRENMHKVHFMCLLSRGMYLNRLIGDDLLKAQAMSIIPGQFMTLSKKRFTIETLSKILTWYQSKFPFMTNKEKYELDLKESLEESFRSSSVLSYLERSLVLIILLRTLGLLTRLVMSLQPFPLKPLSAKTTNKKPTSKERKSNTKTESRSSGSQKKKSANKKDNTKSHYFSDNGDKKKSRRSKGKKVNYKDDDEEEDSEDEYIPSDESDEEGKKNTKKKQQKSKGKLPQKKDSIEDNRSDNDDDFEEESFTPKSPVKLLRKTMGKYKNRKIVSDDSEAEEFKGCDIWTEVFVNSEDKWFSIGSRQCTVTKPHVIESQASKPVHYVLCFDNDGHIKDITPRYASKWLTETRKLRTSQEWIEETLEPYRCPDTDLHVKENNAIQNKLISQPIPTSLSELKNHPLYVLKRHLLKFEAIYPNSAVPVGYLKNEPIYARECVHVLHSRENWLKEGRAVRVKEEPYKMVKSRARWNRKKENPDALDLETFGYWQTEEYIPPPAYNGKVPRNGYGNLELFRPSMLPAGTVHLKLPGLNKVAKKLDIDCVPAMTGWDSHSGYSHPVLDGFIVCEEFKDILLAAWDEDQEIQKQREAEKKEKRVIQNWRLLTKGLLIKEKLKRKYLLQPQLQGEQKTDTPSLDSCEKADDLSTAWPMNKAESQSLSTATHFKTETM